MVGWLQVCGPGVPHVGRTDWLPVLLDVATALALGGDYAADVALVRAQPELLDEVASDPTSGD